MKLEYMYDLGERTYLFARNVRLLTQKLPSSQINRLDCNQVIRSSGSVAANYIEASECLSQKDAIHRLKIVKKEARESLLWLRLLSEMNEIHQQQDINSLILEADEIIKIFGAIIRKKRQSLENN